MSSSWQNSLRDTSPNKRRSRSRSKSPGSRLYEPTLSSRAKWNQPIISEYGDDDGMRPGSVSPSRQRPGSRTSSVGSRTGGRPAKRSNSREIKSKDINKGSNPIAINYTSYDEFSARRKSDRMSPEKTIRSSSPVKSTGVSPKHSKTSVSSGRPSFESLSKKMSDSSDDYPMKNNNEKTIWSKKLSDTSNSNSYSSRKLSETGNTNSYSSRKLSDSNNFYSSRKLSDSDKKMSTISTGSTNGVGVTSSSFSSANQSAKSQSVSKFSLSALKMPIIEAWDDISKTTSNTSSYQMSSSSITTSSSYMSSKRKGTSSTYIG